MKQISFNFNGQKKTIIIGKDIIKKFIGIVFILISAGLLGIFELVKMGWDASLLKDTDFWISYFIKLAMLYIAFFGAYIFRKSQDLRNPKILIAKETLKSNKILISNNFKTDDCEKWLENVLNYERKLNLFKTHLINENSKITLIEPVCPENTKHFLKIRKIVYNLKLKDYYKKKLKREYIEKQVRLVEKHYEVIDLYRKREYAEAKQLYSTFEAEDAFKVYKPEFKKLNFKKLFNVSIDGTNSYNDAYEYKEAKVLSEKIIKTIAMGCVGLALISSIVLDFTKDITVENIIYIAMNMAMVLWYVLQGILTADRFVFGVIASADSDRLKVCNKYRDDCILIGDDWANEIKYEDSKINKDDKEGN